VSKVILGINLGETIFGKKIADGSSCLFLDNKILTTQAEERIEKKKYAGGYIKSYKSVLNINNMTDNDIDIVVTSSCCENERLITSNEMFKNSRVISCNHHLSHALSVFSASNFEKALVCVFDGGGNTKAENTVEKWWSVDREQHTYYIIDRKGIEKVGDDFNGSYEMGFGEVYRAFVKFLKLGSAENAGKMMALAANGNPNCIITSLFNISESGALTSNLSYSEQLSPNNTRDIVKQFLISIGYSSLAEVHEKNLSKKADIAAWVQRELEKNMCEKVKYLSNKFGINEICISGGVAYNCKANGYLYANLQELSLYISPFAGDVGQSIGNVCYGSFKDTGVIPKININKTFLGTNATTSIDTVKKIVDGYTKYFSDLSIIESSDLFEDIATLLSQGKVGAVQFGNAELGPRALGNRSILGLANCKGIKDRINHMKCRETYMPLAPIMFEDIAEEFFIKEHTDIFELMTTAVKAKKITRVIQGALHIDETARIQSIKRTEESSISSVLKSLEDLGERPILVNTSFNPKGMPISDSTDDAISYFAKMPLDFLAIDKFLLLKKASLSTIPSLQTFSFLGEEYLDVPLEFVTKKCKLHHFKRTEERKHFNLFEEYADWFIDEKKFTTIRYKNDALETISSNLLPLFVNKDYRDTVDTKFLCTVHIEKITVKNFLDLDTVDAINDGFSTIKELRAALIKIYGGSIQSGLVSIYNISPVNSFFDEH
jgi:carbamoyltransferase